MLLIYIPEKRIRRRYPRSSKDVLTEDLHTTPERAISTRQSVCLVSKKVELDQFSPQKRKFMELLVLMIKEITDVFF